MVDLIITSVIRSITFLFQAASVILNHVSILEQQFSGYTKHVGNLAQLHI